MKDFLESWRANPEKLTLAIRHERQAFFQPPQVRLPEVSQRFLVGAGNDGATLLGRVITDPFCDPEIKTVLEEVRTLAQGLANAGQPEPEQPRLLLQFFLPPDAMVGASYPEVQGVSVEWLQWIPVDEQSVYIDKHPGVRITPAEGNVGGATARLLGHLKWWEQAIRSDADTETPYRTALLVNNAVTLLDWHFTTPGIDPREHLADHKARKFAAQLIHDLADVAQACVEKTEHTTEKKAKKHLATLADEVGPGVQELAETYGFDVHAARVPEFEKPLKPTALISEWVAKNGGPARDTGTEIRRGGGDGEFVLQSLLPAFAAEKLFDDGRISADDYTAIRQTCSEFLVDAIEIAAGSSKGKGKKRWREIGEPIVRAFSKPVSPRSGSGGV